MWFLFTKVVSSGVTLLEGARGQGMAGCPIDQKGLTQSAKIEARNARAPCGVGSRCPLKVGSRGRSPRELLCISMRIQNFQRKLTYVRLLS